MGNHSVKEQQQGGFSISAIFSSEKVSYKRNQSRVQHSKFQNSIIDIRSKAVVQYECSSLPIQIYNTWEKELNNAKRYIKQNQYTQNQERTTLRSNNTQFLQSAAFLAVPLLLPEIQETHSSNFCGTQKKIKLFFDIYPFTLDKQIAKRKQIGKNNTAQPFNEQQIWYLLYQLVKCSKFFQRNKKKSGDIRPKNILINQDGEVALINYLTFPGQKSNFFKSIQNKEITFLAPQQLADIERQLLFPRADPSTAESFSIGLTIVDAALLFDSQILYCLTPLGFKSHIFHENLIKWKSSSYSPFLIKTIINMLEVLPLQRPSPGQIHAILHPYQNQILSLKQFIPEKTKSSESLERFKFGLKPQNSLKSSVNKAQRLNQ